MGALEERFEVFLPQRDGGVLTDIVKEGLDLQEARERLFKADTDAIIACDVLVIVLDGRTVDEGAAFELGFAHAIGKTCVGIQTDTRRLLPLGNNLMIEQALLRIEPSVDDLVRLLSELAHPPR